MLLVPTRLDQSPIHGLGIFAERPIMRGTPVWRFTAPFDQAFDPVEIDRLPDHARAFFDHYSYLNPYTRKLILCFDNARFTNHSDTPNVAMDYSDDPFGIDIAIRDIAAGEEITSNYADIEEDGARGLSRPPHNL